MNPQNMPGIDMPFLKRTALATLIVSALVALFTAVYVSPAWGGRYLLFSIWSTGAFTLTAALFSVLLFQGRRALGLLIVLLKICWLGLVFAAFRAWPVPEKSPEIAAIFFGITTPMAVLVLRVIGTMTENARQNKTQGKTDAPGEAQAGGQNGRPEHHGGEYKAHP